METTKKHANTQKYTGGCADGDGGGGGGGGGAGAVAVAVAVAVVMAVAVAVAAAVAVAVAVVIPTPLRLQQPTVVLEGGWRVNACQVLKNTVWCLAPKGSSAFGIRVTGIRPSPQRLVKCMCNDSKVCGGLFATRWLDKGERNLRQSARASCRARGILIVAWGRQGYAHLDARKSWT